MAWVSLFGMRWDALNWNQQIGGRQSRTSLADRCEAGEYIGSGLFISFGLPGCKSGSCAERVYIRWHVENSTELIALRHRKRQGSAGCRMYTSTSVQQRLLDKQQWAASRSLP
jgi:hypothetical protein